MMEKNNSWYNSLKEEFEKEYFKNLMKFINNQYETKDIYPPKNEIYNAFNYTTLDNVKVVFIGQDPYHGKGQANGLAFSVSDGIKIPPSLRNIYKELSEDLDIEIPTSGNLENWAKQGILLLNSVLTVEATKANSHQNKGWECFTDFVIKLLSDKKNNIVFVLWGAYAQKKGAKINRSKHYVIESSHPSPLSAYKNFFGSKPFSKTNEYLKSKGLKEINWKI